MAAAGESSRAETLLGVDGEIMGGPHTQEALARARKIVSEAGEDTSRIVFVSEVDSRNACCMLMQRCNVLHLPFLWPSFILCAPCNLCNCVYEKIVLSKTLYIVTQKSLHVRRHARSSPSLLCDVVSRRD